MNKQINRNEPSLPGCRRDRLRNALPAGRVRGIARVITHQHPGVNPPPGHSAGFPQCFQEELPIDLILEDVFPAIAPCHDVVEGTGILDTNASWHRAAPASHGAGCQDMLTDPYEPAPAMCPAP